MANLQETLKNPDFLTLPLEERRKVILTRFPDFRGLSRPEQDKVISFTPAMTSTREPQTTEEYNKELAQRRVGLAKKLPGIALPIAGDIVGSGLVPQLKGPSMGVKLLNMFFKATGAGTGSFLGSLGGQKIEKGEVDVGQAGKEALLGFGGEAGFRGAEAAFRKGGKPALEFVTDITFLGSGVKKKMRDNLMKRTTDRAENFIFDVAPDVVKGQKLDIEDLGLRMSAAFDENRVVYEQYKEALNLAADKEGGQILLDDTAQYMGDLWRKTRKTMLTSNPAAVDNKVIRELGFTPSSNEARQLKKLFTQDTLNPKEIEYILTNVFPTKSKVWYGLTPDIQAARETLKEQVLGDLEKLPKIGGKSGADLKRSADETYKALKKFNIIKEIYDKSFREVQTTGEKLIQPKKLAKSIYNNERRIKKEMPELWGKLKEEADFYNKIAEEFKRSDLDIGPASIFSRGLGGAGGAMLWGPAGVPIVETFGAASAYALMNKKTQKVLQGFFKGVLKPTGKAGLHMGGREVMFPEQ